MKKKSTIALIVVSVLPLLYFGTLSGAHNVEIDPRAGLAHHTAELPASRFERPAGGAVGFARQSRAVEFLGDLVRPLPGGDAGDGKIVSGVFAE